MQSNPLSRQNNKRFLWITTGCGLFILLTIIAMFTYSGGAVDDPSSTGYSFTHNFLSNLGMLTSESGHPNWISAFLFFTALGTAGASLVVFFILFRRLFSSTHIQAVLSLVGSILGIMAGISFMGIAFAPADIARPAHIFFVTWAFRLFPLAVVFYIPAMFMDRRYPKVYPWIFSAFCLLLVGYYLLMTNGPSYTSPGGLVIQVVGHKIISYASILSIGYQSIGAYYFLEKQRSGIND